MHLLGWLAAHRRVGEVGSLPLVLDDALAGVPGPTLERALALLERMSSAVQVIYLTTAPEVVAWAARQATGPIEVTQLLPAAADAGPVIDLSVDRTAVDRTAVDRTAVDRTAVEPTTVAPTTAEPTTAVGHTAVGHTAVGHTAVGHTAVGTAVGHKAARPPLCVECRHPLAGADCGRCHQRFCDQHLVRLSKRPPLCMSCAVVAAGARPGRR
jgi:hypothetical protein